MVEGLKSIRDVREDLLVETAEISKTLESLRAEPRHLLAQDHIWHGEEFCQFREGPAMGCESVDCCVNIGHVLTVEVECGDGVKKASLLTPRQCWMAHLSIRS